jgi:hypothetical protein
VTYYGSVRRFSLILSATAILVSDIGCRRGPLKVERLLQQQNQYNGKIVIVTGCFRTGMETTTLQPCGDPISATTSIWIDDVRRLIGLERVIPSMRQERRTSPEKLDSDEAEKYQRLMSRDWPKLTPVILRGEFQSSEVAKFGHLSAFKCRLILHKVIALP